MPRSTRSPAYSTTNSPFLNGRVVTTPRPLHGISITYNTRQTFSFYASTTSAEVCHHRCVPLWCFCDIYGTRWSIFNKLLSVLHPVTKKLIRLWGQKVKVTAWPNMLKINFWFLFSVHNYEFYPNFCRRFVLGQRLLLLKSAFLHGLDRENQLHK